MLGASPFLPVTTTSQASLGVASAACTRSVGALTLSTEVSAPRAFSAAAAPVTRGTVPTFSSVRCPVVTDRTTSPEVSVETITSPPYTGRPAWVRA